MVAFFLLHLVIVITASTGPSRSEMDEEIAAHIILKKNNAHKNPPKGIS